MALSALRALSPYSPSSSSSSTSSSPSSTSTSTSASSLYSVSYSSISPPLLCTDISPTGPSRYPLSLSPRPTLGARHSLETLIHSHGNHPTPAPPVTSSFKHISPPVSSRSASFTVGLFSHHPSAGSSELNCAVSHSRPQSRPIAIPQRSLRISNEVLPAATSHGEHLLSSNRASTRTERTAQQPRRSHRSRDSSSSIRPVSGMRTDRVAYLPSILSTTMSPASRPSSPAMSFSHASSSAKPGPAFHLGALPRFHPAVYQSTSDSTLPTSQPPSPRQVRQPSYRPTLSPRDSTWHYRDMMENLSLPRTPPGPMSPSPSAPRLDPLRSPGPVTPLALEESGGYLAAGCTNTSSSSATDTSQGGPSPELIEKLIAQEQERSWQKGRKTAITR